MGILSLFGKKATDSSIDQFVTGKHSTLNQTGINYDDAEVTGPGFFGVSCEDATFFLKTLLAQTPDAIYFKDKKSKFILASSQLAMVLSGQPRAELLIGKTDADFFTEEHARQAFLDEESILRTGNPLIDIEEKETYADGHITWAKTSKMPLFNKQGDIIGTWGTSRDITALKKTEDDLRSSNEQLQQSQKMEAFGQLAGGIAHDFNNMLGGILGTAQLLERKYGAADPRLHDNLSMIIDTAKRAGDFTSQLLAFARKSTVSFIPVDINTIIASVVKLLSHTLEKRIHIVERLYEKEMMVKGDFGQIQNVFLNLAVNARDAMNGDGTLTFSSSLVAAEGNNEAKSLCNEYVRVTVSDTGSGMDKATLARAFEPFFTTKPPGKGTGLGLASVYGTVKSHNGLIEVTSNVGKGTSFSLLFPLLEMEKQREEKFGDNIIKGSGGVLVVDDEEIIRKVVAAMLREIGYTPYTMADSAKAISWYAQNYKNIDLVIVDMNMPGIGGYECVSALKKINPALCIVMATGYNLSSDTQKIIAKCISGFIQKPFNLTELSHTLADLLA